MTVTTTTKIFFSEGDIRKILRDHIESKGFKLKDELEIVVQDPNKIPKGAVAGDCIGIYANVI